MAIVPDVLEVFPGHFIPSARAILASAQLVLASRPSKRRSLAHATDFASGRNWGKFRQKNGLPRLILLLLREASAGERPIRHQYFIIRTAHGAAVLI